MNAAPSAASLADIQASPDARNIRIDRVGVKGLRLFVTERAYENPRFVEDLVRDIAVLLEADPRITRYRLSAENFESIHNHSAFAQIEGNKIPAPVSSDGLTIVSSDVVTA